MFKTHFSDSEMYQYSVYGLTLQSNHPLASLLPISSVGVSSVGAPSAYINFVGDAPFPLTLPEQPLLYPRGNPKADFRVTALADGGRRLFFAFGVDYFEFVIPASGSEIRVAYSARIQSEHMLPYLLGSGIGTLLLMRGMSVLHGSVLKVNQQAILLIGHKGAGKSTCTTALIQAGCALLNDDLAPLLEEDSAFYVPPGLPQIRLCSDAAALFYQSPNDLPLLWADYPQSKANKHYIDIGSDESLFWKTPLPIGAIYVLAARNPTLTQPIITPLTGVEAIVQLLANCSISYMINERARVNQIARFKRLLMHVRLCRLERPQGLEYLPQITQALLDDTRRHAA